MGALGRQRMIGFYYFVKMCPGPLVKTESPLFPSICVEIVILGV